jgi:hypothetical protein
MALRVWATLKFLPLCKQGTWNLFQRLSKRSEEKQFQFFALWAKLVALL